MKVRTTMNVKDPGSKTEEITLRITISGFESQRDAEKTLSDLEDRLLRQLEGQEILQP